MANSKYIYIVGKDKTESVKEAAKMGKIPLSSLKAGFKRNNTFERNGITFNRLVKKETKEKEPEKEIIVLISEELNLLFNTFNEFYSLT